MGILQTVHRRHIVFNPAARERPLNGRITYYKPVDSNEIEVVWSPDGK